MLKEDSEFGAYVVFEKQKGGLKPTWPKRFDRVCFDLKAFFRSLPYGSFM